MATQADQHKSSQSENSTDTSVHPISILVCQLRQESGATAYTENQILVNSDVLNIKSECQCNVTEIRESPDKTDTTLSI